MAELQEVRRLTDEEMEREDWDPEVEENPVALKMSDGRLIYPSADPEGNRPGCLFGHTGEEALYIVPEDE